ncbi:UNVERIFIED_CONTAM: hypothetical protein Scaly_0684500 [Sesamum calycinum]|uniref:Uncharacterized protein n=1 Tax=Sesamum calycinum TaxID=2727403 RepID=A0AAW2R6S8_9LAMI
MNLDQNDLDLSRSSIHSNVVRKLPLSKCGLTSHGTLGLGESCTIVVYKEIMLVVFLSHKSWWATLEWGMEIKLMDPKPFRKRFSETPLESDMSKNPSTMFLETNKFNGTNYNIWLRNLRIVLHFKNQCYILNKPPSSALSKDSSPEERLMLDDVSSIMLHISDVYTVTDRRIRMPPQKHSLGQILLKGPPYKVMSRFLHPMTRLVNYNMNGLEQSVHELINMWFNKRQRPTNRGHCALIALWELAKGKKKPRILNGLRQKFRFKGKGYWKRECPQLLFNQVMFVVEVNTITNSASWVLDTRCGAHICNDLQVLQRSRKLTKDEMILRLGDGKTVAAKAIRSIELAISHHVRWIPLRTPQLKGVSERRNRTLLDMVGSMMSFTELPLSFWGYALEMTAKLLNIAPSKKISQTTYEIWHGKPASYKYLKVWGSLEYIKRSVGDKLDTKSSLCRFIRYPEKTAGYYFYDLSKQKLKAMKFEMDLMGSNRALTLVDPPKGVKLVRCKWVYKHKLRANKEWRKVTLSNLGSTLRKPTRLCGELILEGYSDASFQSDNNDANSQLSYVSNLTVVWLLEKVPTRMDSTTEFEYIAAPKAAKEGFR